MAYSFEVMQRSLVLAETMQVGLELICLRFGEGLFEETLSLLQDITQAFISIQQALLQGREDMCPRCLTDQAERMQVGLSQLVSAFEHSDWENAVKALENDVMPGFMLWKNELERCYRPSVVF